jgi:hypothetical protein
MKLGPQQKCLHFCFTQGIGAIAREHMDAIVELLATGTVVKGFQAIVIQSHLSNHFKRIVGISPKAFRQQ